MIWSDRRITVGIQSEGEGPEAIGMAVRGVISGKPQVPGGGGSAADGAQVGMERGVVGEAEGAVFEGCAQGVGKGFLEGCGEVEALDAMGSVAAGGAFGELASEAGGIDAGAVEAGVLEVGVEGGFLLGEGNVLIHFQGAEEGGAGGGMFEKGEGGEIVGSADIDAEGEEGMGWQFCRAALPVFPGGIMAASNEVGGEEGGVVVGGLAEVFLLPGLLIGAGVAGELEEVIGGEVLAWIGLCEARLEAVEKAVADGVGKGYGVDGGGVRGGVLTGLFDQCMEKVVTAAMGGDDGEGSSPGEAWGGDGVEAFGVGVEGEFVEDAGAALAGLGVGVGGEAMDAATVGEGEGEEAGGLCGVEGVVAIGVSGLVEDGGKGADVLEEEAGLQLVAGGDPGIETGGG